MLAINSCVIDSSFDCQAIEAQQQPPAQLLVDRVMPIADRRLRHLRDQRLGIAQQQMHRRTEAPELALEQFGLEPHAVPRALHDGAAGRGVAAHEQRNAEDAFVAHDGDFGRRAVLHDVEQRHDGRGREIDVAQLRPRFVEDLAELHGNWLEMRDEPLVVALRQRGEKMIPAGTGTGRRRRALAAVGPRGRRASGGAGGFVGCHPRSVDHFAG